MKRVLRKFAKMLMYVSLPILAIALVITITLLVIRTREVNSLNDTYDQARQELNKESEDKQLTIEDLRKEFQDLTREINQLRAENQGLQQALDDLQVTGYATISGRIFPFVATGAEDFSQYQRVCAESVSNPNIQSCRTVSALKQEYTLSVPNGSYKVYAELFPTPGANSPFNGYRAYYTDYIACVQDKSEEECNASQLTDPVVVEIAAGDSVTKVDPIDWQRQ